jgi:hypothetical protein
MNSHALMCASVMALGLAACGPQTPPVRAALDCPPKQGDLTRTNVAADGKSCAYKAAGDVEISLQLVAAPGGDAQGALKTIEAQLLAGRLAPSKSVDAAKSSDSATTADDVEAEVRAAVAEAVHDAAGSGTDAVAIAKRNGIVIGEDDNGTAHINLPGIHIVANEKDETANIKVGPITVNAGGEGATVRMSRTVRLRGEQLRREKRGLRATFIYAGKDLPNGYKFVGYEAAGPKSGPLAVAVVKSKGEGPDGEELYPDVKKLVRLNGGV